MTVLSDTFDDVYVHNSWNGTDSRSGPGSGVGSTHHVATSLLWLMQQLDLKSVLDVGCGDCNWMPDLPGYVGVDISVVAVTQALKRHPSRRILPSGSAWPRRDLVICRDVMQHLSLEDGTALLGRILNVGARFVLASTYQGGNNYDIESGAGAYSPDLTAPPFSLRQPVALIFDGWDWGDGTTVRDPRKFLGLWPTEE